MKLTSMRIVTADVAALTRFYGLITATTPIGCSEHYTEIETPAGVLAICSQEAVNLFNAAAARPKSNRSVIIEFEVTDVDTERARLAEIIGTFVMEPTDQPWGNRSMLFRDPDGNLINVYAAGKA